MCNKIIFLFIIPLILISCRKDTTGIETEEPLLPGYQKDIPWPSLADSPWPMHHHDPQSTGRSNYVGPQVGVIEWENDVNYLESGISIGPDSTIYYVIEDLFAINYDGTIKWTFPLEGQWISWLTPLIAADGTIYTGKSKKIIALLPDLTIKWEFITDDIFEFTVNIGQDGTLYILDRSRKLYAISDDGTLLWSYSDNRFNYFSIGMSFSPDGSTLYIPGGDHSLVAFDVQSQSVKWTFGDKNMFNSPLVDSEGNIYILPMEDINEPGRSTFYALNPQGTVRWFFKYYYKSKSIGNAPTMDKNGNVYFATDTLYSFNYSGQLNWKVQLDGYCDCPLVCDANSNIYVGTWDQHNTHIVRFMQFDIKGNLIWQLVESNQTDIGGSPAISDNGSMYFPTWNSTKLYSIR